MKTGIIMAIIFILFLVGLKLKDDACIKKGGHVTVVSERTPKGTMNHTECRFD